MKVIVASFFSLLYFVSFGQTPKAELPKVVGPSPSVAGMQKYGDTKISTYSGVPDITIPLYTINLKDISIPISISYHGSGVKVDEEASRIGLGWSLQAGGTISRNVLGLDDIWNKSMYPNSFDLLGFPQKNLIATLYLPFGAYTYDISNKVSGATLDPSFPNVWADMEPDIFYYNFLGNNGKFILKKQDTSAILEDPSTNLKIKLTITPNTPPVNGLDVSCKILATTSDGTLYYFDQFESCETDGPTTLPNHITAWYLTKIQTIRGTVVNFNYLQTTTGYTSTLNGPNDYVYVFNGADTLPVKNLKPRKKYNNVLLTSIDFPGGNMSFNYDDRVDVQGDKRLTSATITNSFGVTIKKIDLIQDYFTANSSTANTVDLGTSLWGGATLDSNWIKKRLKLTELRESSADGQLVLSHKFGYNETLLPFKNSSSRDHWGYFNNAPNGNNLIPDLYWAYPGLIRIPAAAVYDCSPNVDGDFTGSNELYQETSHKYYAHHIGANREVDTNYSQAFLLNKIIYPTGGSTQFSYEQNTYDQKKSFINDENSACYNVIGSSKNVAFLTGVAYVPNNYSQSFNFSITGNDTLPGEGAALVDLKFKTQVSSITSSSNSILSYVRLKNASGTTLWELGFNSFDAFTAENGNVYSISFPSQRLVVGNYSIQIVIGGNTVDKSSVIYSVLGSWYKPTDTIADGVRYKYAGGVRVKNISDYDLNGSLTSSINYFYHFQADSNQNNIPEFYSTGKLMERPVYLETQIGNPSKVILRSQAYASATVGYDSVIVEQNNIRHLDAYYNNPYRANRYKMYYTGAGKEMMPGFKGFPYVTLAGVGLPNNSLYVDIYFDHKPDGIKNFIDNGNGKLVKSCDYLYDPVSGSYSVIKQTENTYTGTGNGTNGIVWADRMIMTANSVGATNDSGTVVSMCLKGLPMIYGVTNYFYPAFRSSAVLLAQQTEKSYEKSGVLVNTTSFSYNSKYLLQQKVNNNSRGEVIISNFKYPSDYSISGTPNNGIAAGIQNLQGKNIITPVIEQYIQKSSADGSAMRTIASLFTSYKPTNAYADVISKIENSQPLTDFAPATITASGTTIDSRYNPKIQFVNYDSYGNILEVKKVNDIVNSYIWDYSFTYPVAQVANSSQADIAYNSFEADGSGNWNIGSSARGQGGITGSACYQLSNGSISKTGLTSGTTYIVSYWTTNSAPFTIAGTQGTVLQGKKIGNWTYFEHRVSGVSQVSIPQVTGLIDELRLYPVDAQMTTYTYAPLIGMTSTCTSDNRISYYEYDGLARLQLIRDQDGNIIKTYEYHYKTPGN